MEENKTSAESGADVIVVKYGGNAMISGELKKAVVEDLVSLSRSGRRIVLVHGGGPEIDVMLRQAGIAKRVVNGLRYTDAKTMEIAQMTLCGKINKELCALIIKNGGNAIGLCGIDGALLRARRAREDADGRPLDLGLVGEITAVNTGLLHFLLGWPETERLIPVISPVAFACDEPESASLNVNADTAAAKIAAALCAESLILMTDVPGIMRDVNNDASLIRSAGLDDLAALQKSGVLRGGMIPKAACCRLALLEGVKTARIIDGRVPHILDKAINGKEPAGTTVT